MELTGRKEEVEIFMYTHVLDLVTEKIILS